MVTGSVEPLFLFLTCPVALCPDSARLCEKIPQARRARMIFSANPQGRALHYPGTGLPLQVKKR